MRRIPLLLLLLAQDKRPGCAEKTIEHQKRKIIACTLKVAVQPDADKAWFDENKKRFEQAADGLWKVTRGNMAIVEVAVTDKASEGDILIENLDKDQCDSKKVYGYWDAQKRIHLGGKFQILTFLHEWGHVKFDLPEEYGDNPCECLMSTGKTIRDTYCDKSNHRAKGASCWERVLAKFPAWSDHKGDRPALQYTFDNK